MKNMKREEYSETRWGTQRLWKHDVSCT